MDETYFSLWKVLIERRHRRAAVGLLCDAFGHLAGVEHIIRESAIEHGDIVRASLREDLMDMIGDHDGRKLKHWLAIFLQDDHAEFLDLADGWVRLCEDESPSTMRNSGESSTSEE